MSEHFSEWMEAAEIVVTKTEYFDLNFDKSSGEWYCSLIDNGSWAAGETPGEAVENAVEHYREIFE